MRSYGVSEGLVDVCRAMYRGVKASVVLDEENSRWFDVGNGLRQGCPLSPLLYSIFVMWMVEKLKRKGVGVMVEEMWVVVCR